MPKLDDAYIQLGQNQNSINQTDPSITNRYEGGGEYDSLISDLFNKQRTQLGQKFSSIGANRRAGAGGRLRSQGITGGSVFEDTISGADDDVLAAQADVLADLGVAESGAQLGRVDKASGVDYQNLMALFQKYGLLNNTIGTKANIASTQEQLQLQKDAQPGVWDDIFGALSSGGNLAEGIGSLIAASDIRLKENIENLGVSGMGFPIISFNYKGSKRRYKGSIAQEVEKTLPEAVVERNGIKYIDYSKIDVPFTEI